MPTYCYICGFENHLEVRFCGNCGVRLVEAAIRPSAKINPTLQSVRNQEEIHLGIWGNGALAPEWQAENGERRNITVLFVDLCAYTSLAESLENDVLFDLIQQFIEVLSSVVYRYEGMVDKVLGDGLMAFFGAPVAHENNAERAVRAALDMLNSLQMMNQHWRNRLANPLNIHIGIHSGSVILGNIGGKQPFHYTAVGDTVNLARRLQEVAGPGEILVSKRVFDSTQAYFEFESISDLELKGISHSINGYRVVAEKEQPDNSRGLAGYQAPMIGRESELCKVLDGIHDSIAHRRGMFILIRGEAGIGKSRLTREVISRIEPQLLCAIEGHSLTYRRSISYWLFKSALENYISLYSPSPRSCLRTQLREITQELMGSKAVPAIPYLEELLKLEQDTVSNLPYSSFLGPEQRRQQIFLTMRDFLEAAAYRKSLLLILEDLHWADDASLDLLASLSTAILGSPLIVYATTRSVHNEHAREVFDQLQKSLCDRFWDISLENLSLEESQVLFQELLASSDFPMEIQRRILLQAEGNPFYLEEIIRMLIDHKILQEQDGRWAVSTDPGCSEIGIPDTVQDLIQARFDRLEVIQKKVLQVASLIGRQFEFRILAAVLQSMDGDDLREVLFSLVKKSFLAYEDKEGVVEFSFCHGLTSDTIYRTLVRREKEEWHGLIGEALERMHGSRVFDHIELLASHYLRSNRVDRALYYSILAGQKAARDYATEQARWYFEEAKKMFDLTPHTQQQIQDVCLGLGDAAMFTGDYTKAQECYKKAFQIGLSSQCSTDARIFPVIKMKIGATYARQGDFDLALSTLWEAFKLLSELENSGDEIEKARILDEIGWVFFLKGSVEEARESLLQGLSLVDSTNQFDVLASIYNRLGAVAYQSRAYQEASDYVRNSLALREKIGDLAGVARLYNNLGLLGLVQGYLREAEECFLKSYEILKKLGDAEGVALTAINAGLMKCERGEFQPAAEYLDLGFHAASQIGHRFYIGLARMYMGRLQSMQGEYDLAGEILQECIAIFNGIGAMDSVIDATIYLGENYLLRDKVEAALDSVTTVFSMLSNDQGKYPIPSVQYGRVIRLRGVIHRYKGEFEPASKLIRASAKVFEESNEQLELARSIFELGRLAEMGGNLRAAREYFRRARTLFSLLGADLDLSRLNQVSRLG